MTEIQPRTCSLLENVTTRLSNVFAEEFEHHGAEVFKKLLALLKQLLNTEFKIKSKSKKSSVLNSNQRIMVPPSSV